MEYKNEVQTIIKLFESKKSIKEYLEKYFPPDNDIQKEAFENAINKIESILKNQ